jgi:hypothetical protein
MYLRSLVYTWNICRITRLIAGIPITYMGIKYDHWPSTAFGLAFVALGLFTTRCCATGNCDTNYSVPVKGNERTSFEEIK